VHQSLLLHSNLDKDDYSLYLEDHTGELYETSVEELLDVGWIEYKEITTLLKDSITAYYYEKPSLKRFASFSNDERLAYLELMKKAKSEKRPKYINRIMFGIAHNSVVRFRNYPKLEEFVESQLQRKEKVFEAV